MAQPLTTTPATSKPQPRTFHPFPRLPLELRLIIYNFAILSSPRIVYLLPSGPHPVLPFTPPYPPIPALLHVSSETRQAALRHYQWTPSPNPNLAPHRYYFAAHLDTFGAPFALPTGSLVDFFGPIEVLTHAHLYPELLASSPPAPFPYKHLVFVAGQWLGLLFHNEALGKAFVAALPALESVSWVLGSLDARAEMWEAGFVGTVPVTRAWINGRGEEGAKGIDDAVRMARGLHWGIERWYWDAEKGGREAKGGGEGGEVERDGGLEGVGRRIECRVVRPVFPARDEERWWSKREEWKKYAVQDRRKKQRFYYERKVKKETRRCVAM